jgi:hypothetical protein
MTKTPVLSATFGVVKRILLDLGFTMHAEHDRVRFDHPASDTWFVFKPARDDEAVFVGYLVGVRRLLDARGLMDAGRFEELLNQRAAG